MKDLIYDNIQDLFLHSELILMPVDVLKGNVKAFEHVLSITSHAAIKEHLRSQIKEWKDELARRQEEFGIRISEFQKARFPSTDLDDGGSK